MIREFPFDLVVSFSRFPTAEFFDFWGVDFGERLILEIGSSRRNTYTLAAEQFCEFRSDSVVVELV